VDPSGEVTLLNDGSLTESQPTDDAGSTSWTYPDPLWIAGVTAFDKFGTPDHVARVTTFTTAPMQRDREFTGHAMLTLYASTEQTDLDAIVKVPLVFRRRRRRTAIHGVAGLAPRSSPGRGPRADQRHATVPQPRSSRATTAGPGLSAARRTPADVFPRPTRRPDPPGNQQQRCTERAPMTHFYGRKVGADTYHHDRTYLSSLRPRERPR
jgi:uncharacterized protein